MSASNFVVGFLIDLAVQSTHSHYQSRRMICLDWGGNSWLALTGVALNEWRWLSDIDWVALTGVAWTDLNLPEFLDWGFLTGAPRPQCLDWTSWNVWTGVSRRKCLNWSASTGVSSPQYPELIALTVMPWLVSLNYISSGFHHFIAGIPWCRFHLADYIILSWGFNRAENVVRISWFYLADSILRISLFYHGDSIVGASLCELSCVYSLVRIHLCGLPYADSIHHHVCGFHLL